MEQRIKKQFLKKLKLSIKHWEKACIKKVEIDIAMYTGCACCDYKKSNLPCYFNKGSCPISLITGIYKCIDTPFRNEPSLEQVLLEIDFLWNVYYCIKNW